MSNLQYTDLNEFTKGYIDAIIWLECNSDNPDLEDKTFDDFAPKTITQIVQDCAGFDMSNTKLLNQAYEMDLELKYRPEIAGHDFWLTRNGHGVGFWDRGLGAIGEALTTACKAYKSLNLYLGDDNKLYLEG